MSIFARGNDALGVNPHNGIDDALSVHGSNWLWAVTAIYLVAFVCPHITSLQHDTHLH